MLNKMCDVHEHSMLHSHFSELSETSDRHHNEPVIQKGLFIVDHTCMISFKHLSSRQSDNQVCQQQPRGSGRSFCVGSREEGTEQLH